MTKIDISPGAKKTQQFPDFISPCLTHGMGRQQCNACINVVTTEHRFVLNVIDKK